jgi:CD109 antigen
MSTKRSFQISVRKTGRQIFISIFSQLSASTIIQNYTLTVKIADENFEQSVDVFTIVKRYSVFIQTDKPIYKPGDIVKFRVLIIDFEMKPYRVAKLRVELFDALDNVVNHFEEEEESTLEKGVYVNEFEIATEPMMGQWGIRVISSINEKAEDKREEVVTEQKFEVKEYILPRFEVIVDTNHDVTQDEGVVRLTVSANYTFGEYVKGKAVITAKVFDSNFLSIVQQETSKTVDIEFRKMVEFNIKNDLKIVNAIRPYEVKFEVVFEEGLTGQKMTKIVPVRVHKTGEYFLELVKVVKRFKPGYPFKVKAIVRKFDGSLATDKYTPVKLKIDFFYKAPLCTSIDEIKNFDKSFESNRESNLKNGIAEFILHVPHNTTALSISAQFQGVKASLNVSRHESRSREYLVIKSLTAM